MKPAVMTVAINSDSAMAVYLSFNGHKLRLLSRFSNSHEQLQSSKIVNIEGIII